MISAESGTGRRGRREPLGAIYELLEQARNVEPVEIARSGGQDPMAELGQLIEEARRQEAGPGGEAMARLREQIEAARQLPEAEPYRRPAGDPLEALKVRISGDEPTPPRSEAGQEPTGERPASLAGDERQVGQALLDALERRPLPGPVRAEAARRLAALRQGAEGDEINAIFELIVFGESALER